MKDGYGPRRLMPKETDEDLDAWIAEELARSPQWSEEKWERIGRIVGVKFVEHEVDDG